MSSYLAVLPLPLIGDRWLLADKAPQLCEQGLRAVMVWVEIVTVSSRSRTAIGMARGLVLIRPSVGV